MNQTTTSHPLFSSTPLQPSNPYPFPGRKLLLSDTRRLKLLKNPPTSRSKQKFILSLIQPSSSSPTESQNYFFSQVIRSEHLASMLKRQNHDSLVKKREKERQVVEIGLRRLKTDRKEKLLARLRVESESQKELDRVVAQLRGKKDEKQKKQRQQGISKQQKIKYRNLHNPFFKSFKSKVYLKSKQREKGNRTEREKDKQTDRQRYGETSRERQKNGWNSSRSLAEYFGEIEKGKGKQKEKQKGNSSRFSTVRMKSMYQGR